MASNLGRLIQVSLRSIWPDEAGDFTPWLAKEDNLHLLGETLGIDLELEDEEVAVGSFSADIVCRDTADGAWVVIENQIEKTDHSHLGQILTYAAGLGAKTLVWVASRFTEEHRAALDWLNENTNDDISFFGLEIELWRIGNSEPAPKFNIVSKPNDWSKAVKHKSAGASDSKQTELRQLQFEFWTGFREWASENTSIRTQKPSPQMWMAISLGRTGFHLGAIISTWNSRQESYGNPEIRVELVMDSPAAKSHFAHFQTLEEELQGSIDLPLVWHNPERAKSSKIWVLHEVNFLDRKTWPECFAWLGRYLLRFTEVFAPMIKKL